MIFDFDGILFSNSFSKDLETYYIFKNRCLDNFPLVEFM